MKDPKEFTLMLITVILLVGLILLDVWTWFMLWLGDCF